jgi:hypothetical protein
MLRQKQIDEREESTVKIGNQEEALPVPGNQNRQKYSVGMGASWLAKASWLAAAAPCRSRA